MVTRTYPLWNDLMEWTGTADIGRTVNLMPPHFAKPHVRRNKSAGAGAAAIDEVVERPSMLVIPVKTEEQQELGNMTEGNQVGGMLRM